MTEQRLFHFVNLMSMVDASLSQVLSDLRDEKIEVAKFRIIEMRRVIMKLIDRAKERDEQLKKKGGQVGCQT